MDNNLLHIYRVSHQCDKGIVPDLKRCFSNDDDEHYDEARRTQAGNCGVFRAEEIRGALASFDLTGQTNYALPR